MTFLDTEPAAIHRLDAAGPWGRFRVTDPRQRAATVRELRRGDVPLTVGSSGGPTFPAVLWAYDEREAVLHLSVPEAVPDSLLRSVCATPGLWAAAYLHEAKVQFDLRGLSMGAPGHAGRVLHVHAPRHMVHLPRRRALRVRREGEQAPLARFTHPVDAGVQEELRVADISMTGCAVWRPRGGLPLAPGSQLVAVELVLDAATTLHTDVFVQHVTLAPARSVWRVGCDWRGLSAADADRLQAWIASGRRRRDLVSLSFD